MIERFKKLSSTKQILFLSILLIVGLILLEVIVLFPAMKIKLTYHYERNLNKVITPGELYSEFFRYVRSIIFLKYIIVGVLVYPSLRYYRKVVKYRGVYQFVLFLLASVVFGFFRISITDILEQKLHLVREGYYHQFFNNYPSVILSNALEQSLFYWLLLIVFFAYDFYVKYQNQYNRSNKLEAKLAKAQLNNLKMQLRPHFLFNSLNTISMMIRQQKNNEATQMVSGLGDLLRKTLNRESLQLVKVQDEIDFINEYLKIEQERFKDRLNVNLNVSQDCNNVLIPNLILQPLVENAFKHGISNSIGQCELVVKVEKHENGLKVQICNTGELPNRNIKYGVGLTNVVERLKNMYGEDAKFDLHNTDGFVCAELNIPIEYSKNE